MATSRRTRQKPQLHRASTDETPEEGGTYTVETRERQTPPRGDGPAAGLESILEALRGAGQIGIYRQQPQWARGHLQTLHLGPGEELDFQMLDQLQRYWGGGVYAFRPMHKGKFQGSTRSVQFDGPTLFQGRPHPKDPSISAPVSPEVLPQRGPHYQSLGYGQPHHAPAYDSHGYGQPQGPPQASPELRMLGSVMERMMGRLDSLEQKLSGPQAAPAQAPDQIQGVLQTLKLAQQINELMNPQPDFEDDEEEGEEWKPSNPQEALMMMAMKKFDENPEAFGEMLGKKTQPGQAPPQQSSNGPGPRLVRAGEPQTEQASRLDPQQLAQQLRQLDPQEQAKMTGELLQSLDQETLQALMQMASQSAAG